MQNPTWSKIWLWDYNGSKMSNNYSITSIIDDYSML